MDHCIYCNSTNLQRDLRIGLQAEVGTIGLEYTTKFIFGGVEPVYAELCKDCGSITRFYLKNIERNWRTK